MSGTKRFTQFDTQTGEAIEGFVAVIKPKFKSSFERHFTLNQSALLAMAQTLSHEQTKVLLVLLVHLDYENFIQVPQVLVAEQLGMRKQHVNRAMKGLMEYGILLEGPKVGRSKSYRLNPNYGWKGTIQNHEKALKNGFSVIDGGRP